MALPQFVVLSSIDWDAAWQRHQAFAAQLAQAGHEVFFVENSGLRNPGPRDLARVWRRARRAFCPRPPRKDTPSNLRIVAPLLLPPTWPAFRRLNARLFVPRLMTRLQAMGLRPGPIVMAYLPNATTLELLDRLSPALTVYDCVDNFHGLPSPPRDLAELERRLLDRSDLVLTTSRTLFAEKSKRHSRVRELHHGVSADFFIAPPESPGYRKLCYYGTLWRALDYAPVKALAEAGFEVTLIGPQKEPPPPLPDRVCLLPAMDHSLLPQALAGQDVLLLPYADDEYNHGVIPAKIYECLATGRPVVASPLPALEPLRDALYTAKTPSDWVEIVRALPQTENAERRETRLRLAREHAEERCFSLLQKEIKEACGLRARV